MHAILQEYVLDVSQSIMPHANLLKFCLITESFKETSPVQIQAVSI